MSVTCSEVRRGAYFDSVVLMQLQRALAQLPGVQDAGVVMGTEANLELMAESDLLTEKSKDVGPDDLLIAVMAEDEEQGKEALAQVDRLLKERRSRASQTFQPRSMASAMKTLPEADWVLISVPGRYAADVAREALQADKHVFLYSDNVALEDEVSLKDLAQEKGLLLMGPDCGTAIVNGVGLGFANHTRRGSIGLVAASGTGLQAVSVHVDWEGGGISQAIGTGGRDLSPEVGGATTRQALGLLTRDPQTEVIVLISKPPAPEVATRVLAQARNSGKPIVVYFMGQPVTARRLGNLHFAFNLKDAAQLALEAARDAGDRPALPRFEQLSSGYLRGLFSGGTLAYEAVLGLQSVLAPLYTNVPLREDQKLSNPLRSEAHTIVDLGADEFTQGRLHPMMDNTLRIKRLQQEAAESDVGVLLLDVVLGEGSHPDPASELAPAIASAIAEHNIEAGVLLVGTEADPQDVARQREQFEGVGATVFDNTVDLVASLAQSIDETQPAPDATPVPLETLQRPLAAINVGLESFYESLTGQEAEAVHVAWRPPAGGNEKMMTLLAKLKAGQS